MSSADLPVLVAGGGIGGLAAALALARRGLRVQVLERRPEWSAEGAGIQLSPNGVSVLRQLEVADLLAPMAGAPDGIVVREAGSAAVLQRLPLGSWIARRHGAPYWQVHRGDLQQALLTRVARVSGIELFNGAAVEAVEADGAGGSVTVRTADGRCRDGIALVACDGAFSALRASEIAADRPRFSGRTATRTVVDVNGLAVAERSGATSVGDDAIDLRSAGVWLAPGAHIVHYPVRAGREIAVVVVRTEPKAGHGWSTPVDTEVIEGVLARVAPRFASALGRGHTWRRWSLYEAGPFPHWTNGHVALLGDAAHPTLPFLAQGGSLALEDAVVLADCLAGARERSDIPRALAAYAGARMARTTKVVAAARRNGRVFHLSGFPAVARNVAMRLMPGERVMASYDWVYGWKPPG